MMGAMEIKLYTVGFHHLPKKGSATKQLNLSLEDYRKQMLFFWGFQVNKNLIWVSW